MSRVDFNETFAHVAKFITIRCILALGTAMDLEIHQMDVKTVFLNEILEVEIYMDPLEGFVQWGDTEIVALCNSKDSAHIVANFGTLPSARKLLFIHENSSTKSLLCPKNVYQISKLEY